MRTIQMFKNPPQEGLVMKYFVLNPNKDDEYGEASRWAIRAYMRSIAPTNPLLAEDLRQWLEGIEIG